MNIAFRSVMIAVSTLALSTLAVAAEFEPPASKPLDPATRYSGRTPIDLTNGIPFNNGTYGVPNAEYEDWSKHPELPGVSEKPYPYARKADFISDVSEWSQFASNAIFNWEHTSDRWPEAKAYAQDAITKVQPALDRLNDALSHAKSSGESGWANSESEVRRALVDMRLTYTQLHHNVSNN